MTEQMFADSEGRGLVAGILARKAFDPAAPLPDLRIRPECSWEPAQRHYRDLTDAEKDGQ